MFPGTPQAERERLLSVVVVGGGPTGVEFAAELCDFVGDDLAKLYPEIGGAFSITVVEGVKLLGGFDASLRDYLTARFKRKGIKTRIGANVTSVSATHVTLSDGSILPHGLLVWNTGLAPTQLISNLDGTQFAKDKWGHVLVDERLRAVSPSGAPIPGVFALGDCASVQGERYAATAQVAEQQGAYVGAALVAGADPPPSPFVYRHRGSLAGLGFFSATADFTSAEGTKGTPLAPLYGHAISGAAAFVVYRSAYLTKLGSLRNKIAVPLDWLRTWLLGRDTTRF